MSDHPLSCPRCPFTSAVEDALLEHLGLDHPDERPLSAHLGGLYEQTGLFEGPVTSWGARHEIVLVPSTVPGDVARLYARVCEDLHPMQAHYGPEGAAPRPRPQDRYWAVWLDEHLVPGRSCGDGHLIGFAWTQAPAETTRAYGFGLFPECRRLGHGVCVKEALLTWCFAEPGVHKLESEVLSCNHWSLRALHGPDDPMREEGRLRETIQINGQFHDRIFFGVTRPAWVAWQARRAESGGDIRPRPGTVPSVRPDHNMR